MKVKNSFIKNV